MDVVASSASRRHDIDGALGSSELRGEDRSTCFCEEEADEEEEWPRLGWLEPGLSCNFNLEILAADELAVDPWEVLGVPGLPDEGEGYSGLW